MKKKSKKIDKSQISKRLQQRPAKAKLLLLAIIIALISVAVYFNALSHGFVYDDKMQVVENHWIKDVKYVGDIFSTNTWGFKGPRISNYYRPFMYVVYMLNYRVSGLNPLTFHAVNVLFHAGVSVLVFIMAGVLFREYWPSTSTFSLFPSFAAATLFATHPIHTEAVTWVSGLPELSFTFFFLLSLYLYTRSESMLKGTYMASVISFFIATLFKETALTIPLILVAYDLSFRKAQYSISDYLKRYTPFCVIAGIYFILRFHVLGAFAPHKHHMELTAYQHIINVLPLFSQYLAKLLLPINLNAFHVFHPISSLFAIKGILSVIVTMAFAGIAFLSWKKNKSVFFCLALVAIPLIPVLYIPGVGENTFAERYLYLPSVGFVLLISLALMWARLHMPGGAMGFAAIPMLITGLYSIGTINRNKDWKDDYTLYSDMVKKSPDAAIPHNNIGNVLLFQKGQTDLAIEQYHIALKIKPDLIETRNNLGVAYGKKGLIDQAIDQFQLALRFKADDAEAHCNLGLAYMHKGWTDKAIEEYQRALSINQYFPEAHNNLGLAYADKGLTDKAVDQFRIAVSLNPDYAEAHNNLGIAYGNQGLMDEAIGHFETAARLNPAFRSNLTTTRAMKRSRERP